MTQADPDAVLAAVNAARAAWAPVVANPPAWLARAVGRERHYVIVTERGPSSIARPWDATLEALRGHRAIRGMPGSSPVRAVVCEDCRDDAACCLAGHLPPPPTERTTA